jgi:hypothetical protein
MSELGTAIVQDRERELQAQFEGLKAKAEALVVKDRETCLEAKTIQRDVRGGMKFAHLLFDGFVQDAKANLERARDRLNKWINPFEEVDALCARKVKDYETQERLAAEAEEKRINEERRRKAAEEAEVQRKAAAAQAEAERKAREKELQAQLKAGEIKQREAERLKKEAAERAAEAKAQAEAEAKASVAAVQDVKVQPDIPKVAGVPSRVNWRFRIVDAGKVPRAFCIPDEQKIGQLVRTMKNKETVEALIPGIEVYKD